MGWGGVGWAAPGGAHRAVPACVHHTHTTHNHLHSTSTPNTYPGTHTPTPPHLTFAQNCTVWLLTYFQCFSCRMWRSTSGRRMAVYSASRTCRGAWEGVWGQVGVGWALGESMRRRPWSRGGGGGGGLQDGSVRLGSTGKQTQQAQTQDPAPRAAQPAAGKRPAGQLAHRFYAPGVDPDGSGQRGRAAHKLRHHQHGVALIGGRRLRATHAARGAVARGGAARGPLAAHHILVRN